jgi:hypothetical protein
MPTRCPSVNLRVELLALTIVSVLVIWFCDEMVFAQKIPFFRDLVTYFYPIKFSVADAFQSGSLPLWDRHMAAGFPIMAALQSAVFYPPTLAFYLLPFAAAVQFTFVFHYFIAACGAFVLLRSWHYPIQIALIGTILFAFGGTTVSLTNLLNHFQSAVWLPWVVFLWEQAATTKRWKDIAVFAIGSLCQVLAGSPEIYALTLGLLVFDTIRLKRDQQIENFLPALALLMGSVCIVFGLGMIQFLPTVELMSLSRRDQPIPAVEALGWSLRPSSLLGLLLPTLEADPSLSIGVRLLFAQGVPFLLSHYMGVITVYALSCWFGTAPRNEFVFVTMGMGASLVFAFGHFTPIYPFLYEWVPVFRVMRFPEKYFYFTFALLVFAAVRGLRRMDDGENHRTSWVIAATVFGLWLAVYATFRLQPQWLADVLQPPSAQQPLPASDPKTIAAILVVLEKQVAIGLVLAALLGLGRLGLVRKELWQVLLVATVFFDLSSANKPLHFLREATLLEDAARILHRPPSDPSRLFYYPPGENLHPSYVRVTGRPDHAKATEIALNNLLPNAGMLHRFEYFQDIDALGRRSYTDFLNFINALPADRRGRLLGAVNVQYVVAFHSLEVKGLELVQEYAEHYSKLYKVTDSVPRVYIASRSIYDTDAKSTFNRLSSDGFDLRRDVVVDLPIQLERKNNLPGKATMRTYKDSLVEIDAGLDQPGILVLTDAFHPGWKVWVNGMERTMLRANYLFRGVELPAGNHKVEFRYEPESFRIGALISLCSAGLLIVVPFVSPFRRLLARVSTRVRPQPFSLGSE